MSAPRLISPILDGFELNETISCRDGAHCLAASEQQSGKRFVVKIVSVPASGVQMDALLMTGAFSNRTDANAYFKEQARAVLNEAKTLRHMATLGGFTDFDCVQVVPSASGSGFEIYMLSPQRQSVEQLLCKEDLTHLEVVNMGLDLCAALTACRHAGYFYANLKPGNVFCNGQHYLIGDLGFMPLSSMNRLPLPEKYRSQYSPPELVGGGRMLNDTADVYALGLLLYQAYNMGKLPGENDIIGKLYAPPLYADYEMAQIILRACAPDPAIRWKDPQQMGMALTRYLQRNGMRNTPVIPPVLQELAQKNASCVEEFLPEYPDESVDMEADVNVAPSSLPVRRKSAQSVRKRRPAKKKPFGKSKLVVAVLALILLIELIVGILVLTQDKKTNITSFSAEADMQNQSVTLYLTCDGDVPDAWTVTYTCGSEDVKNQTFSGETITIYNLTAGEIYTFTLQAPEGHTLTGLTQINYTLPNKLQ